MAKKNKKQAPKKKEKTPKKPKVDKTFGLKNKKGKKAAEIIKKIKGGQVNNRQIQAEKEKKRETESARMKNIARREREEKEQKEKERLALLEKEKKAKILCEAFERGECRLGTTCEYLHDWKLVKRTEKLDPYIDPRLGKTNMPEEKAKLCYNFLKAVNEKKYGYFWVCPNKGSNCQYKHSLPPGYVLTETIERSEVARKEVGNSEKNLDQKRNKLFERGENLTPLTLDYLLEWQKERSKQNLTEQIEIERAKNSLLTENKITGKDYFLAVKRSELLKENLKEDSGGKEFLNEIEANAKELVRGVEDNEIFLDEKMADSLDKLSFDE